MQRLTNCTRDGYSVFLKYPFDKIKGYIGAIKRLAAYEDTGLEPEQVAALADPWISVGDRLPDRGAEVLVYSECLCEYYIGTVDNHGKIYTGYVSGDSVTHWMPLPEPPGEEEAI
jgi:hypothetical protein